MAAPCGQDTDCEHWRHHQERQEDEHHDARGRRRQPFDRRVERHQPDDRDGEQVRRHQHGEEREARAGDDRRGRPVGAARRPARPQGERCEQAESGHRREWQAEHVPQTARDLGGVDRADHIHPLPQARSG
jgi:hypothetical protein